MTEPALTPEALDTIGALQLWRVQYEDQSRDCDGTYLLEPHFVFAPHVDDAWNRAEELYDVFEDLPNVGVWEARPATDGETIAWETERAAELARLRAERDALQTKIDAAPHGQACNRFLPGTAYEVACDCWKSAALTGEAGV